MTSMTSIRLEAPTRWRWFKLLCLGAITWIVAVVALGITQDPNLIPLTVTAGGFVVPVCGAIFVFDRLYDSAFPPLTIVEALRSAGRSGCCWPCSGSTCSSATAPRSTLA
jgi:hypothetical protein